MLEPVRYGFDGVNNTEFCLDSDNYGNWFLTIPMPIGGIGMDVIHKLTELHKLECEYSPEDYIPKQIKLMQSSPEGFKTVSWR